MNYETYYQAAPSRARDFRKTARQALKGFWWTAILVTLIASLLGGVSIALNYNFGSGNSEIPLEGEEEIVENEPLFTPEQAAKLEQAIADGDFEAMGSVFSEIDPTVGWIVSNAGVIFTVASILGILFALFVSSPVTVGYQRFCLEVLDGNESEIRVGTLFRFFKESYSKTILLNIVHSFIMSLTFLPLWVCMAIGSIPLFANSAAMFTAPTADMIMGELLGFFGLTLIGLVISAVISIPVSYAYSMAHMIMADYPTVGAIEALRLSRQMMKGNKGRLFCLDFSFFGWYFLGACACGLGTFAVVPFHYTARAAFYEEISGRKTPEDVEFPSINPEDYIVE